MKLCECGCGKATTKSKNRYLSGHNLKIDRIDHKGIPKSAEVKAKLSAAMFGRKHPNWKGDKVSYRGLHQWLDKHWPKTGICENCKKETKTQWANISGQYKRSREDFIELCQSCHWHFDHC